jgi:hypothetical protein
MRARVAMMNRVVRSLTQADAVALNDRELLARFAADADEVAFSMVVARHTAMVLGVCRRTLPRPDDAEDACSSVGPRSGVNASAPE